MNIVALTVLSIFIYIPYVFVADLLPSMFSITETADIVFGSPIAYLLWFLFSGIFVMLDLLFGIYEKEWNTILHHFYNSIEHRKNSLDVKDWYQKSVEWHKDRMKEIMRGD